MPTPRHTQISLDDTRYYHCTSRCVRRAYLCGIDPNTGDDLEHRRTWVEERILELSEVFALRICAYAVLSNHYHVVLYVDREEAEGLSPREVVERWHALFQGTDLSRRFGEDQPLDEDEQEVLEKEIETWRGRLMDISWYMRVLNESIARRANAEDECTGRFWEGRFKCQALLDEAALVACMTYVDLNPVRAKVAKRPEESKHTSIRKRFAHARKVGTEVMDDPQHQAPGLMPLVGNPREDMPFGLPFRLSDYLDLVEWTGRQVREEAAGRIPETAATMLGRLGLEQHKWLTLAQHFEVRFRIWVGALDVVRRVCRRLGYRRTPGAQVCRELMPGPA